MEQRVAPIEVRAVDDQPGRFEAVVMRYDVVDDYDTIFDYGVFTDSLERRLPRITWGHDWAEVIGRYVDYRDTPEGLTLIGQLDDFDAVPRARQAYAQMQSGTIDEFSVGFRAVDTYKDADGRKHFRQAILDEVALVLSGAVPGTQLVAVRHQQRTGDVPAHLVIDLAREIAAGTLTREEATLALDLAAGGSPSTTTVAATSGCDDPDAPLPQSVGVDIDQADVDTADRLLDSLGL